MLIHKRSLLRLALLSVMVSTFLAACNRPGTEPTIDPNVVFTAAAQTVEAQLTAAAVEPTMDANAIRTEAAATIMAQIPPTKPSALGGATPSLPGLAGTPGAPVFGTLPVGSLPPISTLPAISTPTTVRGPLADKYVIFSQYPVDGTKLEKDYSFDMEWVIQNTGTNTWNQKYYIEWYNQSNSSRIGSGDPSYYYFTKNVVPNDKISIKVDMKTNTTNTSATRSYWALKNDQGVPFGVIFVELSWGDTNESICCSNPDSVQDVCKGYLNDVGQPAVSKAYTFCKQQGCTGDFVCP